MHPFTFFMNLPNKLTLSRIVLAVVFFYLVFLQSPAAQIGALLVFLIAYGTITASVLNQASTQISVIVLGKVVTGLSGPPVPAAT